MRRAPQGPMAGRGLEKRIKNSEFRSFSTI
jgi:hypothetical protein